MLKKFVFLMMLTTSVFAGTAPLKSAFDDLTYSLTVEWDQKDQEFAQNSLSLFQMKVAGASVADKKEFFKILLKGQEIATERFVLELENNNLSQEEAIAKLNQLIKGTYREGAAFAPSKYILIGAGAATLVFIAGILMWEMGDPQVFGEEGWK